MKRLIFSFSLLLTLSAIYAQNQVYELRTYELEFFGPANVLHNYFKDALIPALNRQGVKHVGAFEEVGEALPKKIYLLISHENIQSFQLVGEKLNNDTQYQKDAEAYLKADPSQVPYGTYSSELIASSTGFPELTKREGATYFELRTYTSYNEDALRRKVNMFNESEFDIFDEIGLPTVFFGVTIAGSKMPSLTYMLGFKDRAANEAAWAKFGPHPEWRRLSASEENVNSMNNIYRVFLKPLEYSQL